MLFCLSGNIINGKSTSETYFYCKACYHKFLKWLGVCDREDVEDDLRPARFLKSKTNEHIGKGEKVYSTSLI